MLKGHCIEGERANNHFRGYAVAHVFHVNAGKSASTGGRPAACATGVNPTQVSPHDEVSAFHDLIPFRFSRSASARQIAFPDAKPRASHGRTSRKAMAVVMVS